MSYGVLKSNSWEKHIHGTVFFIGRQDRKVYSMDRPRTYRIDLELPHKCISRQHAVIVYNFKARKWEIRCLSKKNMITVDQERFAWGDSNIWLRNKTEIIIGPEKMLFLEAN